MECRPPPTVIPSYIWTRLYPVGILDMLGNMRYVSNNDIYLRHFHFEWLRLFCMHSCLRQRNMDVRNNSWGKAFPRMEYDIQP